MKEITLSDTLKCIEAGNTVCMLIPVSGETQVSELMRAKAFVLIDEAAVEVAVTGKVDMDRVKKNIELSNAKTQKNQEAKEKKQPKPKELDVGKVMALYRAGWNISSICTEVGASYPTVKKYIDQESSKDAGQADS